MSYPAQQSFRPVEANVDLSRLQFSDYSNAGLQVADYSKVEFLQNSDSEEEEFDEDDMEYSHTQSEFTLLQSILRGGIFGSHISPPFYGKLVCVLRHCPLRWSSECERRGTHVSGISSVAHGLRQQKDGQEQGQEGKAEGQGQGEEVRRCCSRQR